jgi:hypothetical protein
VFPVTIVESEFGRSDVSFLDVAVGAAGLLAGGILGFPLLGLGARRRGRARAASPALPLIDIRRLVYSQYWRREDPILQLPPGAEEKVSVSLMSGMTEMRSREFSSSLGFKTTTPVELSGELAAKFGFQISVTSETTVNRERTLRNPSNSKDWRFALWSVIHRLEVSTLTMPPGTLVEDALAGRVKPTDEESLHVVEVQRDRFPEVTWCEVIATGTRTRRSKQS